jgi:hypothetical protein
MTEKTESERDIVARLREKQRRCKGTAQQATWTLCADAMAEIERLRSPTAGREAIIEECAKVAEVERLREALALAETIIRQLPENGKNWDTISRFWAAVSALDPNHQG